VENSDEDETQVNTHNKPANLPAPVETTNPASSDNEASILNPGEARIRKPPGYLRMYDTTGGILDNDNDDMRNLAIFGPGHTEDPVTYEEAAKYDTWKKAMNDEIQSIERNKTWELVDLPRDGKVIGVKWIYKTKLNEKGEVEKYKARLVAKGYSQKYGIDYKEVFAPVARWDSIRSILAVAALKDWKVYQLDVKSAFLHGELLETVFVEQPLGYVKKGAEDKVYKLNKALYGLKQAPRAWYNKI
jgi:hypothetical protein